MSLVGLFAALAENLGAILQHVNCLGHTVY